MAAVFKKLNLKDQTEIVVINSPSSFETEIGRLSEVSVVRDLNKARDICFLIAFVTRQPELNAIAAKISTRTEGDVIVWIAYPKGTSRRYKCDFNRDSGWEVLGAAGFEGVRQVAIDEDWSALRFRRIEFIKSMKRDPKRSLTASGKKRTSRK